MNTLHITRGLPGSGKTTFAQALQAANPSLWRFNRDELRAMLLATSWPYGDQLAENHCTIVQAAGISGLLRAGADVICDDTNLDPTHVAWLAGLAHNAGANFEIHDLRHIPLDVCIARDAQRTYPVGAAVISRMHTQYIAGGDTP